MEDDALKHRDRARQPALTARDGGRDRPGRRIYAARFMGDRLYLVTFRETDPFFVIDLSDPARPSLAGELKLPGFSNYLHPYDATHIIGVGKTANFGAVKLSPLRCLRYHETRAGGQR